MQRSGSIDLELVLVGPEGSLLHSVGENMETSGRGSDFIQVVGQRGNQTEAFLGLNSLCMVSNVISLLKSAKIQSKKYE